MARQTTLPAGAGGRRKNGAGARGREACAAPCQVVVVDCECARRSAQPPRCFRFESVRSSGGHTIVAMPGGRCRLHVVHATTVLTLPAPGIVLRLDCSGRDHFPRVVRCSGIHVPCRTPSRCCTLWRVWEARQTLYFSIEGELWLLYLMGDKRGVSGMPAGQSGEGRAEVKSAVTRGALRMTRASLPPSVH